MKWCVLLIHDGRGNLHEQTLASAKLALPTPTDTVVVDDSDHRLGFAGAVQEGWAAVLERDRRERATDGAGFDFVFHLEGDFLLTRPVPLARMAAVLAANPYIAQLVLKRQAWNADERAAGGIVEQRPDEYEQVSRGGDTWTEHRLFWSTNPSLYSIGWCWQGWPLEAQSEGKFTHRLLADPALRFAFWGGKLDPPHVHHIGEERAGHGY